MFFISIAFIGNAYANSAFTYKQKQILIKKIPEKLKSVWDEPHIKACWKKTLRGSDKAISALYLIYSSEELIYSISEKRQEIMFTSKNSKEMQDRMLKNISKKDYNKLSEAVRVLPLSYNYCKSLL